MILSGMVAENSMICLSLAMVDKICSTSSKKPRRSISSASSSTILLVVAKLMVLRRMWSRILPGVPIITWGSLPSFCFCLSMS